MRHELTNARRARVSDDRFRHAEGQRRLHSPMISPTYRALPTGRRTYQPRRHLPIAVYAY